MKIVLDNERPISWNQFYAGKHWRIRKTEAERVHALVKYITLKAERFSQPVSIIITAYFEKLAQDPDNIMSKFYIDGLKERVLVDDSPKYVKSVTTISKLDKENPRLEILISEEVNMYDN